MELDDGVGEGFVLWVGDGSGETAGRVLCVGCGVEDSEESGGDQRSDRRTGARLGGHEFGGLLMAGGLFDSGFEDRGRKFGGAAARIYPRAKATLSYDLAERPKREGLEYLEARARARARARATATARARRRSFDCVSRDKAARDFAQDDRLFGVWVG